MVVSRMLESSMPSPTSPARMRRPTMNHTEGSWFERKYRSNSKGHPLVIGCIPRKCKKKEKIFTSQLHPSRARSRSLDTSRAREDEGSHCADQKHLASALCLAWHLHHHFLHLVSHPPHIQGYVEAGMLRDQWGSSQKTRFTRVEVASWLPPDWWSSSRWQAGKDWAAVLG